MVPNETNTDNSDWLISLMNVGLPHFILFCLRAVMTWWTVVTGYC